MQNHMDSILSEIKAIRENINWTPVLIDWKNTKEQAVEELGEKTIVLFQVGNFYETYFEDAYWYSKATGSAFTSKSKKDPDSVPMSGSPIFSLDSKIESLCEKGFCVVVVDEVGKDESGKGFKRSIVSKITPATFVNEKDKGGTNIICYYDQINTSASLIDIFTNKAYVINTDKLSIDEIDTIFSPKTKISFNGAYGNKFVSLVNPSEFLNSKGYPLVLTKHQISLSNVISFLDTIDNNISKSIHLKIEEFPVSEDRFVLSNTAIRNLDLLNLNDRNSNYSVFSFLDKTITSMGSRMLKETLLSPYKNITVLEKIYDDVDLFTKNVDIFNSATEVLLTIPDIERISSKSITNNFTPFDLVRVGKALSKTKNICNIASVTNFSSLFGIDTVKNLYVLEKLSEDILGSINENAPNSVYEGGIFREGYNAELDSLRQLSINAEVEYDKILQKKLSNHNTPDFLKRLRVNIGKTGVAFEVKRDIFNEKRVNEAAGLFNILPATKNLLRFSCIELEEAFAKSLTALEKAKELEKNIFLGFKLLFSVNIKEILEFSQAIGYIDMVLNSASIAKNYNYSRPHIRNSTEFSVSELRHPVLETIVTKFVSNDVNLTDIKSKILLGPNMGGKSIYLKSIGLATIMAQAGMFVPAEYFKFGLVDNVFVRAGSGDDFSRGESTFYMEMKEANDILRLCSDKSLILMDEIGRGTDYVDGYSISVAILEKLSSLKVRNIFSTHYFDLINHFKNNNGVGFLHAEAISDEKTEAVLTHKIVPGIPTIKSSLGIYTAKLAGIDNSILEKAQEIKKQIQGTF